MISACKIFQTQNRIPFPTFYNKAKVPRSYWLWKLVDHVTTGISVSLKDLNTKVVKNLIFRTTKLTKLYNEIDLHN